MMNRLRLKHGLRWAGSTPGMRELARWLQGFALATAIVLAVGVADLIDRMNDEVIAIREQAQSDADAAKVLHDCMSGAAGFYYKQANLAFACEIYQL